MGKKSSYRVTFRRRREEKTDYHKRMKMISSGKKRLVIRRTNKKVIAQIIEAEINGDKTVTATDSKELIKYGWKLAYNNAPAHYLTGLLIGYKAINKGVDEAILDIGLHPPIRRSNLFATLKGALDAGMKIPFSEEIIPDVKRIRGEHISQYASKLKEEDNERYQKQFSRYLKSGIPPEEITKKFEITKKKIIEEYEVKK